MSNRTPSHAVSLVLAVLVTVGMLTGMDRLAGAESRLGAALVAQAIAGTQA